MERIREGVRRFRREIFPQRGALYESLAETQKPDALFLTCGDSRLDPSLLTGTEPLDKAYPGLDDDRRLETLTQLNVLEQMAHLHTHPAVEARFKTGALAIHGWVYEIHTGRVDAFNPATGTFEPWADPL